MEETTREIVIERGKEEETQWMINMQLTLVSDNVAVRKKPVNLSKFSPALKETTIWLENANDLEATIKGRKTYERDDFYNREFTDTEIEEYKITTEEHNEKVIAMSTATLAIKHHDDSLLIDSAICDAERVYKGIPPECGIIIGGASEEVFFLYLDKVVIATAKEPYAILALFKISFSKITFTPYVEERLAPFIMLY